MDKQNGAAQLRYLEEVSIRLRRSGLETILLEERHLPVKWNGSYLCRVSSSGSVLYREADIERHHARDILRDVIHTARMTSEYMAMLEQVPQLKASGLVGDYRVLADFGDAVLAGHPTERGVQFVVWGWDWDRRGVHQGDYFQGDYEAAKRDFTVRSGLVPKAALFDTAQLAEFYYALAFVRERDESLSFGRNQELKELMEQVGSLLPESALRQRDAPEQDSMTMK